MIGRSGATGLTHGPIASGTLVNPTDFTKTAQTKWLWRIVRTYASGLVWKDIFTGFDISGCHNISSDIIWFFDGIQNVFSVILRCWFFDLLLIGAHFIFFSYFFYHSFLFGILNQKQFFFTGNYWVGNHFFMATIVSSSKEKSKLYLKARNNLFQTEQGRQMCMTTTIRAFKWRVLAKNCSTVGNKRLCMFQGWDEGTRLVPPFAWRTCLYLQSSQKLWAPSTSF